MVADNEPEHSGAPDPDSVTPQSEDTGNGLTDTDTSNTKDPDNTDSQPDRDPDTDPDQNTNTAEQTTPPQDATPVGSPVDPPSTESSSPDAESFKPDQSLDVEGNPPAASAPPPGPAPPVATPPESEPQLPPEDPPPVPQAPKPTVDPAPEPSAPTEPTAPPTSATRMVPVTFSVPKGKKACVASGKLQRIEGAINVDPPSVGFGEVAPDDWQSNAAALRLTNSGKTQQTITHISCSLLENENDAAIPYFVIQFGEGGNAPRVKCAFDVHQNGTRMHL